MDTRFGTENETLTQIELRNCPTAASEGYGWPLKLEHFSSANPQDADSTRCARFRRRKTENSQQRLRSR